MQHQPHRHIPCFWTDHPPSLQHRRLTQSVLSAFCHEPVLTQPGHKGGLAHSRLSNQQYLIRSHAPQILPSGLCSLSFLLWEGVWHHPRLVDWPVAIGKSGTIHLSRAAGGTMGGWGVEIKLMENFQSKSTSNGQVVYITYGELVSQRVSVVTAAAPAS